VFLISSPRDRIAASTNVAPEQESFFGGFGYQISLLWEIEQRATYGNLCRILLLFIRFRS
jgi:hypothetical protein